MRKTGATPKRALARRQGAPTKTLCDSLCIFIIPETVREMKTAPGGLCRAPEQGHTAVFSMYLKRLATMKEGYHFPG
jgi:hypothetical protein